MSKFSFQMYLNAYNDANATNSPVRNNFKWTRNINGLAVDNPQSDEFDLAPGETKTLFSGNRTLGQDGTTVYDLSLKPLSSNSYILKHASGTAPTFRTARAIGTDALSEVTVTVNGPVATFASPDLDTSTVQAGDELRIGNPLVSTPQVFAAGNRGKFKVLAKTSTSISVENSAAVAEGPIVLGADFANQLRVYSNGPVQVGDTVNISGGFSSVTHGFYKVTDVAVDWIEFYSTDVLPQEAGIQTQAIAIYSAAKRFFYLESNQKCNLVVNGNVSDTIEPFIQNNSVIPGVMARTATVWSLTVTNAGSETAKLYLASIE